MLQYTGGTTGLSKGAMLSHANLSCNVQQLSAWYPDLEPGTEVLLGALPLFHVFGLNVALNWAVLESATLVLVPDPRDVERLVKSIPRHRVTGFPGVPAMFEALCRRPGIERADLTSLKRSFSGSAPLPAAVARRFEELTGCPILEGFGMTESSPVSHSNPLSSRGEPGSVGVPLPDTDAKIVDAEDGVTVLPAGAVGELAVRGPQVMAGYWRRPEATAETLRDGWLHTGDLATADEAGYFRIVGRVKDMILVGGYNVYPDEVDAVLAEHPAVLEAATIGVPHERTSESVESFAVLRPGASADPAELVAHCRANLAAYKVPRELELVAELPRSSVLKVLRRELRERELGRRRRDPLEA